MTTTVFRSLRTAAALAMLPGLALAGSDGPAPPQLAQIERPELKLEKKLDRDLRIERPLELLRPDCPDPGIKSLDVTILGKTGPFKGRIRITAIVENFGQQPYVSSPGQQSLTIMMKLPGGGPATVLRRRGFQNLAPGATVQTAYERNWNASSPSEGEFPPDFEAWINYDVDITLDGNEKNDDCRLGNNRRSLSGAKINDMMRP